MFLSDTVVRDGTVQCGQLFQWFEQKKSPKTGRMFLEYIDSFMFSFLVPLLDFVEWWVCWRIAKKLKTDRADTKPEWVRSRAIDAQPTYLHNSPILMYDVELYFGGTVDPEPRVDHP